MSALPLGGADLPGFCWANSSVLPLSGAMLQSCSGVHCSLRHLGLHTSGRRVSSGIRRGRDFWLRWCDWAIFRSGSGGVEQSCKAYAGCYNLRPRHSGVRLQLWKEFSMAFPERVWFASTSTEGQKTCQTVLPCWNLPPTSSILELASADWSLTTLLTKMVQS